MLTQVRLHLCAGRSSSSTHQEMIRPPPHMLGVRRSTHRVIARTISTRCTLLQCSLTQRSGSAVQEPQRLSARADQKILRLSEAYLERRGRACYSEQLLINTLLTGMPPGGASAIRAHMFEFGGTEKPPKKERVKDLRLAPLHFSV